MSRGRKFALLGVLAGLVIGGVTVGVVLRVEHDNQVAAKHKEEDEAREQAQAEAREEQREIREEEREQAAEENVERVIRHASVKELQSAITKDAEGEVEEGLLEGPILSTECEPEGGEISLTAAAQDFHCLAVTKVEGGISEGYRYTATENYKEGEFSWRLGGP